MAGQEWRDWFEREELIGQISDIRVQNLQVEREVVQKRTFTRWMNLHLEKCNPPLVVQDLFRDIRDGRVLMALLEELSGCRLLHEFKPSAHRIFRLNNIARVLTFLEERNVKLVSIDAADVADGNSSIVLGLIWNIILFFQIKELTGNIRNQFPSSSSLSSIPNSSDSDISQSSTPSDDRKPSAVPRDHGRAIKTLLHWVQRRTRKYGVAVHDFGKSWVSGMAFLAVIKSIDPSLVDMRRALLRSPRENIEEAFRTAHYSLGIPRLLEPEDVTLNHPDQQSIMTYVSQFLEHFPGIEEDEPSDFLERNKVSVRSTEPAVRNGLQRKREKCSVVKREWVQPPPKIFISSVVEDQTRKRPPVRARTMEDRPWDSEDSSVGSSPSTTDSRPLCRALSLNKEMCSESSSTQPSLMDSAVDSTVDSADSWAETPSEFQPSCSTDSFGDVSSPADLTSLGSPLESDRVLKDVEMLIDEGNFSLSLDARSTLLSEEEEAFRYILELKEDESVSVNVETSTSNLEEPAVCGSSCGDGDSGYFPGHTDDASLVMRPEEVLKLLPITEHNPKHYSDVTAGPNSECSNVPSESPVSGVEPVPSFDDDAEYHVVQYERISISGSEEDVEEHCSRLDEEPLEMSASFSGDPPGEHACRHPSLKEIEDIDQILQDPDELLSESEPEDRDAFLPLVELSQIPGESRCSGSLWSKDEVQEECTDQVYSELGLESLEPISQSAVKISEAGVEGELSQALNLVPETMNQSFLEPTTQLIVQNTESKSYSDDIMCSESELSQSCTMTEDSKMEGTRAEVEEDNDVRFQIQNHQVSDELVSEPEVKVAQQDLICPELGSPQILPQIQTEEPELLPEILRDPLDQMDPELDLLPISNETSLYEVEDSKTEIQDQSKSMGQANSQNVGRTSSIQCYDMSKDQTIQPDESNPETTACAEPGISDGSADRPSEDFVCAVGPGEETFPEVSDIPHAELEDESNKLTPETYNDETKAELILKYETSFNQNQIQDLEIPAVPQHDPEPITTTQLNPAEEENTPNIYSTSTVDQSQNMENEDYTPLEDWITNRGVDRAERYREETRRSLSVTPLQPAPSQPCDSDSDSERPSQDKVDEASVESPMQSPFGLWVSHPGEWGVVEPDHLDVSELNSRNEKLDAIAAPAAEKPAVPRTEEKETVAKNTEDKIQPQPPVHHTPNTQDELREQPKEEPKKEAKEEPRKEAMEEPKEKPKEEPKKKPKEEPRKELKEEPKEKPKEEVKEEPKKEIKEKPKEEPKKEAKEKPKEELKKEPQKELKGEQKEEPQKELNRELKEPQTQKEPRGHPAATTADPKPDESVCVRCNRKVNCCTQNREPSRQTVFSELDLLLLLWLLVFCLLVLPQMDVWSLPALLLNTDK